MRRATRIHFRRWCRRATLLVVVPALLLLSLRLVWGIQASRRLAAAEKMLRDRGIRTAAKDFPDGGAIPRDQNGMFDFLDAMHEVNLYGGGRYVPQNFSDADRALIDSPNWRVPLTEVVRTPAEMAGLEYIWSKNRRLGELLDAAADKPQAILPAADFERAVLYPNGRDDWNKSRLLANLLYGLAAAAHARHDDREALCNLRRLVTLSRLVAGTPKLINQDVAASTLTMAARGVEQFDPEIDFSDPAIRAESEALLRALRNDDYLSEALPRAWEGELAYIAYLSPLQFPKRLEWVARPVYDDDMARCLEGLAAVMPAFGAPNWPRAKALSRTRLGYWPSSGLDQQVRMIELNYHGYGTVGAPARHFEALADCRAAALLLASRLYAAQHKALPRNAADLVPEFLSRLPADPFANPEQPLHYRLDAGGPTVWSVAYNGTDQGGPVQLNPDGSKKQRQGEGPRSQNDFTYGAAWRAAAPPP